MQFPELSCSGDPIGRLPLIEGMDTIPLVAPHLYPFPSSLADSVP